MDEFDPPAGEAGKFYNKALKFLSYRPRSEKEIRDKLKKFKFKNRKTATTEALNSFETLIERVIAKLKQHNFINDEEFVRWWIEQRTNFKPRSLRLIKMELRQKGIDQDLIEETINNSQLTINDLESARKLIERRFNRYKNLPREEKFQKVSRFLASKGFNYDIIKEIFKTL